MDEKCFLSHEKFLSKAENSFPSIAQANMYFFSKGKFFLFGHKIFYPGRWMGHQRELVESLD